MSNARDSVRWSFPVIPSRSLTVNLTVTALRQPLQFG